MRATHKLTLTLALAATVAVLGQSTENDQKKSTTLTQIASAGPVADGARNSALPATTLDKPATTPVPAPVPATESAPAPKEPIATVTAETAAPGSAGGKATAPKISPQAIRMEPRTAKPGTIITITGVALSKQMVDEVFLTDHRFDMKVKVLEQTDNTLKIRVPPFLKPGRQQLLLLTAGETQSYLEQPFYVQIESKEDDDKEVAAQPAKESGPVEKGGSNGSNSPEVK